MQHTETRTQQFSFTRKEILDMIFSHLRLQQTIEVPEKTKQELYQEGGFIISGLRDSAVDTLGVSGFSMSFTQTVVRGNEAPLEGVNVIDECEPQTK